MGRVKIDKWLGLATNVSPYSLPPGGSAKQNNLQINKPGQLVPRPGMGVVYTAKDYNEIGAMYRVASGISAVDDLIVSAKVVGQNTNTLFYLTAVQPGVESAWSYTQAAAFTYADTATPSFAEDRHGRIYVFQGNSVSPVVLSRTQNTATTIGLAAPTVPPEVTPAGNGYFIERVDVLDGGGSYWQPPEIIIAGGGTPVRAARLKSIIQGGAIVAVDVIDGGTGYSTAPTLTVNESGVKGVGFLGYGIIGVDPGLQGFQGTLSVTGNTSSGSTLVTNVTSTSSLLPGMAVRGSQIANGTTIASINTANNTMVLSIGATATQTAASMVINGPGTSGTTDASLSHAYSNNTASMSIAYKVGTTTAFAAATYDSGAGTWSALIPLTGTTNATTSAAVTGTGATARVTFSSLASGLSYRLGGTQDAAWPVRPSGAFYGASTSSLFTANDYWADTDDNTQYHANNTGAFRGFFQANKWRNNNYDFFAAFTPNFQIQFHKRHELEGRFAQVVNNVPTNPYMVYADYYTWDYGSVSLRYYTGPANTIDTSTEAEWSWVTVPVQVANGQPFIEVELIPALKTGTTPYTQYTGYQTPIVRIHLKYCPDSWLNNTASGDLQNAICNGWQRTGAGAALTSSTNKGFWSAGAAATGVAKRPIVDFRAGSAGTDGEGLAAGTCTIIRAGAGMEQNTLFALQLDQINAAAIYWGHNTTDQFTNGSNNPYVPASGFNATYPVSWSVMDKNPANPAFTDEYNFTLNPARTAKTFGATGCQRLYFRAAEQQPGQIGFPGAVTGTPSVAIPGSGYVTADRAAFTLRQRPNLTDPGSTAAFADGQTYTFSAIQITPAATTNSITSVQISSQGTGYYGAPELVYSGGGSGFGLTMDAIVSGGAITGVNITNPGSGFTSGPTVTANAQTAQLLPVMRPSMRGTYRCAYRFADLSQTVVAQPQITTTSGSAAVTVSSAAGLEVGMVVDHPSLPYMTKIKSIVGTALTMTAPATASVSGATANVRDMSKPVIYSNFSPITDVDTTTFAAVPRPTQMLWSITGVTPPARAQIVEFFRTSSDESLVFYRLEMYGRVNGASVTVVGTDVLTDEELFNPERPNYAAVPVVLPNGNLNAYRFGVPRSDMAVCAAYGDRLWYASSTSGDGPNSVFYSEYDEFESCPVENELAIQNNQKSTDTITGLVPFGTYLLAMQNNYCYAVSYNSDPSVDASIQLLANRGMLCQQCHDMFDDQLFAMDERGIYVMDRSGGVEALSNDIKNYWDQSLLDLTYRRRFFVKVDQRTSILRAFVVLKGSGCTTPHMAFCLNLLTKAWWTESWPNGLTCAVNYRRTLADSNEPVYGAVDGDIYRASGLEDYCYRSIASITVTNGGSGYTTPPTVSVAAGQSGGGAEFAPILRDGVVAEILILEAGFGYGAMTFQQDGSFTFSPSVSLTISGGGGNGATATATAQLPVLANNDYPQATVPYVMRTGNLELSSDANNNKRDQLQDRSITVTYRPTATSNTLVLREYFNNSSYPRSNVMARDRGTGFVHNTTGAKTTLDMSATRSALGLATGVAKAQFAGRNYTDMGGADRHIAVELSGDAASANANDPAASQPLIYGLEIEGVADGS
jgi:hypothetical protein